MSNFNQEAYERALSRRDLANRDLEELAQQVEDGEIDDETADELRSGYETELNAAEAALSKAGTPPKPKKATPAPAASKPSTKRAPSERDEQVKTGFNSRWLVGAGILVAALVIIIISVQNSSEPDPVAGGSMPPGAGATGADPCAELADALTVHPDNGFRLALADCYSQSGNAMSAIEHYKAVADGSDVSPDQAAEANVGLGYLNLQIGELENAAGYMETALQADPTDVEAQYFLGMMLVYDLGDPDRGVSYLESVLEAPNLPESVIVDIEAALAEARGDGTGS